MEGASETELTTKLGAEAGSGVAAGFGATTGLGFCAAGQSGTMRTGHSTGGAHKDYCEGAINMNFLDTYFSQVIGGKLCAFGILFTSEISLLDYISVLQLVFL